MIERNKLLKIFDIQLNQLEDPRILFNFTDS